MANFEDYLNDYSLNEESEEQLDPPQVRGDYGEYVPGQDAYGYSDSDYQNGYGQQDGYEDGYSASYDDSAYDDRNVDYDDSYDEDYEEEQPARKGFKPNIKMPSFNMGKIGGSSESGSNSNRLLTILVGLSLLLSLISVISLSSIKSSVKETRDTLSSQIASLATATSQLSDRVSALESGVTTVQQQTSSTEGSSKYITITKQPTSAESYVGRGEDGLAKVFEIDAKGNGIGLNSFQWQKQDAGGTWVNIGFDGQYSRNELNGLQNEVGKIDSGDNAGCYFSTVYTYGLTSQAFGRYRCVVSDSTGETSISDVVEIANKG